MHTTQEGPASGQRCAATLRPAMHVLRALLAMRRHVWCHDSPPVLQVAFCVPSCLETSVVASMQAVFKHRVCSMDCFPAFPAFLSINAESCFLATVQALSPLPSDSTRTIQTSRRAPLLHPTCSSTQPAATHISNALTVPMLAPHRTPPFVHPLRPNHAICLYPSTHPSLTHTITHAPTYHPPRPTTTAR